VTTLPGKLKIGTVTDQGLPFYTGRIRYLVDVLPKSGGADERVFLATPQFEGACVQVRRGKAEAQPIAWQPRETDITDLLKAAKSADGKIQPLEIEVVLTRRNTFGPLHMKPLKAAGTVRTAGSRPATVSARPTCSTPRACSKSRSDLPEGGEISGAGCAWQKKYREEKGQGG
jgi:hypothetical protein